MALHEIPDDGVKHLSSRNCPCGVYGRKRPYRGVIRTVYVHTATIPAAEAQGDDDDVWEAGPQ